MLPNTWVTEQVSFQSIVTNTSFTKSQQFLNFATLIFLKSSHWANTLQMLLRECTQKEADLLSVPKKPDTATLPTLCIYPGRVPAAGSERPTVMRHLCGNAFQSFCMPSTIWSWDRLIISCKRAWIPCWVLLQCGMPILEALWKCEFSSKLANYKALKIHNKIYQKSQNIPICREGEVVWSVYLLTFYLDFFDGVVIIVVWTQDLM